MNSTDSTDSTGDLNNKSTVLLLFVASCSVMKCDFFKLKIFYPIQGKPISTKYWINLRKIGGMDGVFQGLAGMLLDNIDKRKTTLSNIFSLFWTNRMHCTISGTVCAVCSIHWAVPLQLGTSKLNFTGLYCRNSWGVLKTAAVKSRPGLWAEV